MTPRAGKALLIVSLALNLLVGGALAARFAMHEPRDRMVGSSYAQLVPRRFFGDVDRARRTELLDILKQYRNDFSEGRKAAKLASVKLADALDTDPYDPKAAEAAVQAYSANSTRLVDRGAAAALEFIGKLSPDERHMMAKRLRDRAGVEDGDGPGRGSD